MRRPTLYRHLTKGLTHPHPLIAAAAWLGLLALLLVLARLIVALVDDFWLIVITLAQP
ncbi:MAG: hypothetical protein V4459_07000 [Pseudomonadota bacterium]